LRRHVASRQAEHRAAAQREGAAARRDEAQIDPDSPGSDRDYLAGAQGMRTGRGAVQAFRG